MKTKNIAVVLAAGMMALLTSCSEDFLNRPPQSSVVDVNFYKTDAQVLQGSAPLYSMVWKDFCDQANWHIGDARAGVLMYPWGGNATQFSNFTVNGVTGTNVNAYQAFYEVIGQANTIMYNVTKYAGSDVTAATKNHVLGECHFMRATALAYLVMNYGPVAIVDENYTAAIIESGANNLPQLKPNTVSSIWKYIVKDYRYAVQNLAAQEPQTGRVNKWSAEGMLARTYLNMAGVDGSLNATYLDSAKYYADRVIKLSGKSLSTDYAALFLYPYDNNKESLFELQWVYTSNTALRYQYANSMVAQITPNNNISGNGSDGWGGNYTATKWMLSLYDGLYKSNGTAGFTIDKRQKPTFMLPGATYPELIEIGTNTQYFSPITTPTNPSFATIKKYVIGNQPGQTGGGFNQDNPNNTYMLRLAEMYLDYTEAAVLSGNVDATAVNYFKDIRHRAGLDSAHVADSLRLPLTQAWEYVFKERVKEFAMEGLVWYDLVRLSYYDKPHAFSYISKQDRGLWNFQPSPSPYVPANNKDPQGWVFTKIPWFTTTAGNFDFVKVDDSNFMLPIPQVELAQAPSLNDDPVDYDFHNYK